MNLEEPDVRAMVRLVSDVVAFPGGHAEKKRFLMEGICRLVGADAWVWGLSCQRDPEKPQVYVSFIHGGFSEKGFVDYLEAIDHPEMPELAARFFIEVAEQKAHLTRTRHQIIEDDIFFESQAHLAWKKADIGSLMLSLRPLDERSGSTIGFYRRYERENFSFRESRIAHIMLSEVSWLHELGWPEDRGVNVPNLSPRHRVALNLLILGQNRKQIAANMTISVHTAQGYIKEVYRYFQVNSQSELMARFFQGDGRDLK